MQVCIVIKHSVSELNKPVFQVFMDPHQDIVGYRNCDHRIPR